MHTLTTTALVAPAYAQAVDPLYRNWDENGVDVVRGDFHFSFQEASIGSGRARLDLVRVTGNVDLPFQWDRRYLTRSGTGTITTQARKPNDTSFKFTGATSDAGDGATISNSGEYSDIRDSDGVLSATPIRLGATRV